MRKKLITKLCLFSVAFAFSVKAHSQDEQQVKKLTKNYNFSTLNRMQKTFEKEGLSKQKKAVQMANRNGWEVKFTTEDGRLLELQKVVNGKPIYYTTFNEDAAVSTRANHLNSGGSLGLNLMGQGLTAYIWDGGVARKTHQEYDGAGGTNRLTVGDYTSSPGAHAAHVTGTIIASGYKSSAQGMAPHAKAVGYDWNSDKSEATKAAANGMLISNHSYGYATRNKRGEVQLPQYYFGGYIDESRDWDEIMFNAPNYLMVCAAGNDGLDDSANTSPTGGYGFDKLTGHSTAKNNLVVANAKDANIDADGNLISVYINSSSSEGPTDDYRIKPDITGNGTGVYSTFHSSDDAYGNLTGTSMASPNVTGTLLLLQQHHKNVHGGFMRAATLKGIALHTADDAGSAGPDAIYGWGLLNAKKAAQVISAKENTSKIEELTLNSGDSYTITVESDGVTPLLASISWTDRPGTARTAATSAAALVNDLDIRVSKSGTTYKPYKLTGPTTNEKRDNNVDPYERVDIANASGTYTITVTHKGSLKGGSQDFTLVVTGISGSDVACNAVTPTQVKASSVAGKTAKISWAKVIGASYDVRYRKVGSYSWTNKSVSTSYIELNNLALSTEYEVQVRSKCNSDSSSYSNSVKFTTTATETNYCVSKGNNVSDEHIQKVELGSISKSSDGGSGYSDYTSISTNLAKNKAHEITITPKWASTPYSEGYGVFIDYNQDGDFSDEGETVFTKEPSKTTPVKGSFTVPSSALSGATRMRVVMMYNETPLPCGGFKYGETEDYTVVIGGSSSDTEAPTKPSSVTVSNITETSATIRWSESSDNVGVKEYKVYQEDINLGSVATPAANISNLTADTNYTFYVSAVDEAGNESEKASVNFTTLGGASASYCDSKGKNATYEWIDYVAFGGMTNTSASDGGYKDYTNKVANVAQGRSTTLLLSAGYKSTSYNEHWAVYIDYNQDGDFTDAGEKVATGSSSNSGNLTTDITIPSSAKLGRTKMRVSMKYNAEQTPCETFGYGEVEDYVVNITDSVSNNDLYTSFSDVNATRLKNEKNSDVTLYPNPVKDNVQIRLRSRNYTNATYRIVNLLGVTVRSEKLTGSTINLSNLETGIYTVEVYDGQKVILTKLIKN